MAYGLKASSSDSLNFFFFTVFDAYVMVPTFQIRSAKMYDVTVWVHTLKQTPNVWKSDVYVQVPKLKQATVWKSDACVEVPTLKAPYVCKHEAGSTEHYKHLR